MGLIFDSFESYSAALDKAIATAMVTNVGDKAKLIVSDVIDEVVYSYTPQFSDRTGDLKSPENMIALFDGDTLQIENIAQWNRIGFFYIDGRDVEGELADVIRKKDIYHAPARDFVGKAEAELGSGKLDKTIEATLKSMGF